MNIEPYLEKNSAALVAELSEFVKKPLPEEVRCVQVLVFRESMPSVPFHVYFLNRFQGPAKTIDDFQPLESIGLLVDSSEYISSEEAICDCLNLGSEEEQNSCMDDVYARVNAENQRIAQWFAACWQEAGGAEYPYHAFVVEEDGMFNPIELKSGRHIKHLHEYTKVFDG